MSTRAFYRSNKQGLIYLSFAAKIILSLLIVAVLFLTNLESEGAQLSEPYSVLVVAGQSNAQGDNSFHHQMNPALGSHPADSATKIMWSTGDDQFSRTWRNSNSNGLLPLTSVQPKGYFGPEIGLARSLWDQGRRNIVILKVTYGLQRLAPTANNTFGGLADWNTSSVGESYDNLKLRRSQLASLMQANGDTYSMDGFYWVQGESDAVKGESLANYQNNLQTLLDSVEVDLDMHPDASYILGKVSGQLCLTNVYNVIYNPGGCGVQACLLAVHPCSTPEIVTAGNANVRQAIQNVADSKPSTYVVETEDLARVYDFIHLSASAQLTLGSRMANPAFKLPYREEGSNDYDNDGVLNIDEDSNGDRNLGNDDSDGDGIANYLDDLVGPGGGRTNFITATKSVSNSATSPDSVLDWMYTLSNETDSPADLSIEESLSLRQDFVNGSLITPPNFLKQYSTDDGSSFSTEEPLQGTTGFKVTKSNVPVSANGDANPVEKLADTFQNSTSGNKGYIPILSQDRIFTLFTNTLAGTGPTSNRYDIGCVEKSSGNNCTGYPKDFTDASGNTDFLSPTNPVHHYDENSGRIFGATQRNVGYGIVCFDTTINAMCEAQEYTGLSATGGPLGGVRKSRIQQVSSIGSCLYTYDHTLKVFSYDPATGQTPCQGQTTKNLVSAYGNPITAYNLANHSGFGNTGPVAQSQTIGSKIFIMMNYALEADLDLFGCNFAADICNGTRIVCFDAATADGRCTNGSGGYFSNPRSACFNDRFCSLVQPFENKTDGSICAFAVREPSLTLLGINCHNSTTGASVSISTGLNQVRTTGNAPADSANYLPTDEEVEITLANGDLATIFSWKKAYLIASPRSGKAVCINWTTNTLCDGFGFQGNGASRWDTWIHDGVSSTQVGINGDTNDIGYVADGAGCIWAKGENGDTWSFDAQSGSVPCRSYQEKVTVEPSKFYCEVQNSNISGWDEAKLSLPIGATIADLVHLSVTLKDEEGNIVPGYENVDLLNLGPTVSTLGVLDLSQLSIVTFPILTAELKFKAANNTLFASANETPLVVLTFDGDDPQVCYQTRVEDACNIITPLTNEGVIEVTDASLVSRTLALSATSIVEYQDGEICIPNIRVTTSRPPGKVFPGSLITYNILVENIASPDPLGLAQEINLINTIPDGSTYISSNGGSFDGSKVAWPTFNLEGSTSQTFNVTIRLGNSVTGTALNVTSLEFANDPDSSTNTYIASNEIGSLSALGATAWLDNNEDGLANSSETFMEGLDVEVYKGGVLLEQKATDEDGYVEFTELMPGSDYELKFSKPIGYVVSPQDVGGENDISSQIDQATAMTPVLVLSEGEINRNTFAGFYLDSQSLPEDPGTLPEEPQNSNPVSQGNSKVVIELPSSESPSPMPSESTNSESPLESVNDGADEVDEQASVQDLTGRADPDDGVVATAVDDDSSSNLLNIWYVFGASTLIGAAILFGLKRRSFF